MSESRPINCREALRDAGKAYPKSGCAVCGDAALFGCPYNNTPPAERPTPLSNRMRDHLHVQFPATVGHIPLMAMLAQVADIERELAEALEWKHMLSIWGGTPEIVDSFIKGQQERIAAAQEAENQRDELALCAIELASYANESLPQNQPEFLEGLFERVKKYGDAHFRVYGTYETPKGGEAQPPAKNL